MNGIYQNYQIDLSSNNNFVQYTTVQGDGNDIRQIEVELIEHNKPYVLDNDVEVFIAGTKPDTKQIFNSCEITEQGTILIDVTTQMSAVCGRGDYQIILISKTTNQQLKSFPFILFVKEAAFDAETITSSDEFQALNGMVNKIESTLNKTDLVDSMLESSSKILDDTTTAYNNAVQSLEKAQDAIETAESINSTAQESAENAKQSEENSALYSNRAKSYAIGTDNEIRENDSTDNAKYYKEQAEASSASALQSANLAVQKADDASAAETNAMQYAANAAGSERNAKESADSAKTSEENAAQSSSDALQNAANSESSAVKSAQSAEQALESATNASASELSAKSYAESAAGSALKAEEISKISIATPEINGIVKPDGTTITIDKDGTLHGAVAGLTVEDLSNAPHPAVNEIAGVMLTGTGAGQDSPALKSIPLSDLAKGVADKIDNESLLQHYLSETDFTENQALQDAKITFNSDNIDTLITRVADIEQNSVTSADLNSYLPLSGGSISNENKSMNITPSGFSGDGGQSITDFYNVQADTIEGTVIKQNSQRLDDRYSQVFSETENSINSFNSNNIYNYNESLKQNYNILQFNNGIMIIGIYKMMPLWGSYDFILPISFIDDKYQVIISRQGSPSAGNGFYIKEYKNNSSFTVSAYRSDLYDQNDNQYSESFYGINAICIGRWK